jgi:uncharacterized protein YkwD
MKSNTQLATLLVLSVVLNVVLFALVFFFAGREGEPEAQVTTDESVPVVVNTEPATSAGDQVTPTAQVETATDSISVEPIETAEPSPTSEPEISPTERPTMVPSPTSEPTPEPTPEPTATPTPVPSPTAVVLQGPAWLQYANRFRVQAGLPPVKENVEWSEGGRLHSIYMANTGNITHHEDPSSSYFTRAGQAAGENGNLAAGHISVGEYDWAINYWISAPFHGIPLLDPQLETVGFGTHRDVNAAINVVATMDIKQGLLSEVPSTISYPVLYPKDGGEAWVLRYSLPEFPDARPHCGYGNVAGAPIVAQIGSGDRVPSVSSTILRQGETVIDHCVFDETNYINSNSALQKAGRNILDQRDAVVILPRNPLDVGKTYTVELVVNGESIAWSFNTVMPPELP